MDQNAKDSRPLFSSNATGREAAPVNNPFGGSARPAERTASASGTRTGWGAKRSEPSEASSSTTVSSASSTGSNGSSSTPTAASSRPTDPATSPTATTATRSWGQPRTGMTVSQSPESLASGSPADASQQSTSVDVLTRQAQNRAANLRGHLQQEVGPASHNPAPQQEGASQSSPLSSAPRDARSQKEEQLERARALAPWDFLRGRGAQSGSGAASKTWTHPEFGEVRILQGFSWEATRPDGQIVTGRGALDLAQKLEGLRFPQAIQTLNEQFATAIDLSLARRAQRQQSSSEGANASAGSTVEATREPNVPPSRSASALGSSARSYPPRVQRSEEEQKAHIRKLSNIRTELVVETFGAQRAADEGENKVWTLDGVGAITLVGSAWLLKPVEGFKPEKTQGRDALDLTRTIRRCSFGQAMGFLERSFEGRLDDPSLQSSDEERYAMLRAKTNALAEKVRDIHLGSVMEMLGGTANQDNNRNKWKLEGVGNIALEGQQWFDLNNEVGGKDAIGLVRHALNLSYPKAVEWLGSQFGESLDDDDLRAETGTYKEKKQFQAPLRDDSALKYVRQYLRFNRALPETLIERMISRRQLYADEKRRCVFLTEGSADLRDTFDGPEAFKGMAPGSSREFGFLVTPAANAAHAESVLAICESAIDSLSYHVFHPGRSAISASGAGKTFPRKIALEAAQNGIAIVSAFDADSAGDKGAQSLFNFFYLLIWLSKKEGLSQEAIVELFDNKKISLGLATPRPGASTDADGMTPEEREEERRLGHLNRLFFNAPDTDAAFSDSESRPVIVWQAKDPIGSIPRGEHMIPVSRSGYDFVVQRFKLSRERPQNAKDWNESLKAFTQAQSLKDASAGTAASLTTETPPSLSDAILDGSTVGSSATLSREPAAVPEPRFRSMKP